MCWPSSRRSAAYIASSVFLYRAVLALIELICLLITQMKVSYMPLTLMEEVFLHLVYVSLMSAFSCLIFLGVEQKSRNLLLFSLIPIVCILFVRYAGELAYIFLHNWTQYRQKVPWLLGKAFLDLFFVLTLLVYTQSLENKVDIVNKSDKENLLTKESTKKTCQYCGRGDNNTIKESISPHIAISRHYPPRPPYEPYYGAPNIVAERMRKSMTPMSIALRVKRETSEIVDERDELLSIDLPPNVPLAQED